MSDEPSPVNESDEWPETPVTEEVVIKVAGFKMIELSRRMEWGSCELVGIAFEVACPVCHRHRAEIALPSDWQCGLEPEIPRVRLVAIHCGGCRSTL